MFLCYGEYIRRIYTYIATCWLACALYEWHINNNGARNTAFPRPRLSFTYETFPWGEGKLFLSFLPDKTLRRGSRSYPRLRRFSSPLRDFRRALWRKMCHKKQTRAAASRSLITVKYSHGEQIALPYFLPPPLLSFARNCILYDVSSTRNCSLSRMSCLHVGCYDRRVGEGICIYRENSAPHRPGPSYIDQHSSLITMLQLQINKVLIGRCCIYIVRVCLCVRRTVCVPPDRLLAVPSRGMR